MTNKNNSIKRCSPRTYWQHPNLNINFFQRYLISQLWPIYSQALFVFLSQLSREVGFCIHHFWHISIKKSIMTSDQGMVLPISSILALFIDLEVFGWATAGHWYGNGVMLHLAENISYSLDIVDLIHHYFKVVSNSYFKKTTFATN